MFIETSTIAYDRLPKGDEHKYILTSTETRFFVGIFPKKDVFFQGNTLTTTGWMIIRKGFKWDGASGPAIDTLSNMRASMVHDALINMIQAKKLENLPMYKIRVDGLYWRLSREDGMGWFRAMYHLLAIQWNQWQNKITNLLPLQ